MNSKERKVPNRWSEEEDCILYEETQKQESAGDAKDWHRIAAKLPGRTNKDCRKRWVNKVCGSLKKGSWNKLEDDSLLDAVDRHGQKWTLVANEVGFRSPDQCAKRWQSKLNPNLEHGGWTAEEDQLLFHLVQQHGREWKMFQEQSFNRRSTNELKNRYTGLARKAKISSDRGGSVDLSMSSTSSNPDYNTDIDDVVMGGEQYNYNNQIRISKEHATLDSMMHQDLTLDWVNTLDDPNIWIDQFGHTHEPVEDILLTGGMPVESVNMMGPDELHNGPEISDTTMPSTTSEHEPVPGLISETSWSDLSFNPETVSHDVTIVESGRSDHISGDEIVAMMQTDSNSGSSCTDMSGVTETIQTPIESCVGRVTLVIDGCNRNTLHGLLDLTKSLKGRTKIEIE
ncbi:Homeodomain-like protein [Nemania sp. FL0916]|nr:Homeodomain-like protein [Nemania sp. FL0916]